MARLFTSGAEWGDLLDFNGGVTGSTALSSLIVRSGLYSYFLNDTGANQSTATYNFPAALDEFYLRFGGYMSLTAAASENTMLRIRNGTTVLGTLRYDATSATLKVYSGDSATLLASATIPFSLDTWGRIEIHWKIADSPNGVFDVLIDGNSAITFAGDTKPGASTDATNIVFTAIGSLGSFYIDDIALNDTTGVADNSWPGEGKIVLKKSASDGDTVQWTNSAGNQVDNWDYINNLPPGATYITDSTPGNLNLCGLEALDISDKTPIRAWVEGRGLDTVGPANLQLDLKTLGTLYQSGNIALTTNSARIVGPDYKTNPFTGAAWTQAQLDAVQVGPETV